MALIRLDKLVAQSGERSRSEAAKLIRAGLVCVDGRTVSDPKEKVDTAENAVRLSGERIMDTPYQYAMLHKPAGVLTAARDKTAQTVMDLLPQAMRARSVMPVGRLDKDTTGLLLLTNDGMLAHRLLSPKTHVWKEYHVTVDGLLTDAHTACFAQGVALTDFTARPAELRIVQASAAQSRAVVRIREGKHHQVKRMFIAQGLQVLSLHRSAFGPIQADIPAGAYRILRNEEIIALYAVVNRNKEEQHG